MMKYKGYIGKVAFDDDANIFHGEVINLRDVVTFQGESVAELRRAFQDSVDDYLDFCAARGESPEGRVYVSLQAGRVNGRNGAEESTAADQSTSGSWGRH
ncbi:MAG: type II toxin-antitoxin system HicB family antitoxin [Kiritimatiellia bacterium]